MNKWTANDPAGLTFRERCVVEYLRKGKGTREIANLLGVSPRSMYTYCGRIFRKTGTHHRLELLAKVSAWSPDVNLEDEIEAVADRGYQ